MLFVRYDRTIGGNSEIGSTKPERRVDVGESGFERRGLGEVTDLLLRTATTFAECRVRDIRQGGVLRKQRGVELTQLELDTSYELVEAQAPVELVEVSFVDPVRPADAFLET